MAKFGTAGLLAGAGLGVLMTAGVAMAQMPPPDGAPAPGQGEQAGPGGMGGEMRHGGFDRGEMHHGPEMMRAMMMGMHRPPPSKAAHFVFRKGDALVNIKCADDETMKACVDAGSTLLDKLTPPATR